jgi:xylose dehydrogenase (NAD/NADP)
MSQTFRFGIIGTGNIANQFAAGVAESSRCTIAAVGSRSADSANRFAGKHEIAHAHASYDALLADESVDAVYNSLPNSMHHEWTIKALKAGKHALCEKPFATNLAQAEQMFDAADQAGRLLVEAFMYRSHPLTTAALETVRRGEIGRLRLIKASFNYFTAKVDGNVRFDAGLAGGALMDIGCYCTSFATLFAGAAPTAVHAVANLHETGVDEMAVGTLAFPGNILASFTCGMAAHADNTAYLCGSEGFVEIPIPWKPPAADAVYTVRTMPAPKLDGIKRDPTHDTRTVSAGGSLYGLEADDFAAAALGEQPPAVSKQDTLTNQRILDDLRQQIGLAF